MEVSFVLLGDWSFGGSDPQVGLLRDFGLAGEAHGVKMDENDRGIHLSHIPCYLNSCEGE